MSKTKLNELSKEELQAKEKQLQEEVEQLNNVIKASNTPVFDLLIKKVKDEMQDNIAEEEWKKLKENQKKIESYRSIEKTLQNQEDLLEEKEDELENVKSAIQNYQPSLFEQQQELAVEGEAEETEYRDDFNNVIKTGDVYEFENNSGLIEYYLVKKSVESAGKIAIISNAFNGELLLNYPKNRELIENADYVGNIFCSNESEKEETEAALSALRIITDSQMAHDDIINQEIEEEHNENCSK